MARHISVTVGSFDPPAAPGEWPTAETTGASGALTNDANDTLGGATYTNRHFTTTSRIDVTADGATFTNCEFDGHCLNTEGAHGNTYEDCTFHQGFSISSAQDITVRRAKIVDFFPDDSLHVTSDGAILCTDILFEDCYVYNANAETGSHCDGLQVRGSLRLTLRNCYIDLGPPNFEHNAALYLENGPNGSSDDWLVEDCYLKSGYGATLYISGAGGPGIFRNNTIAPAVGPLEGDSESTDFSAREPGTAYTFAAAPGDVTASGNVDENGDPFDVHNP